jgi:hypothetical protein
VSVPNQSTHGHCHAAGVLRAATLALVTFVAFGATWSVAAAARPAPANPGPLVARAAPAPRSIVVGLRAVPQSDTAAAHALSVEPAVEARHPRRPPAPAAIDRVVREAAERWGADPEQLLRVAFCESSYNPSAYNPGHGDSGLFQFIPATWARYSTRAGYADASPFDVVANANTAAMMFSRGMASSWTCR